MENVPFKHAVNSMGWKLFEFWDSSILSNANAKIIRAVKIKSQSSATKTETKVLETIWNDPNYDQHFQGDKFDWSSIAKSYGTRNLEAEEIVEFIVQVSIRDSEWFVAHRYREFDALRKFIFAQNPYNTDFQQMDSKFPGKYLGVAFRKSAIDKRVEGLESFLCYYLENARFCRQNSIDALCSFLQVIVESVDTECSLMMVLFVDSRKYASFGVIKSRSRTASSSSGSSNNENCSNEWQNVGTS